MEDRVKLKLIKKISTFEILKRFIFKLTSENLQNKTFFRNCVHHFPSVVEGPFSTLKTIKVHNLTVTNRPT